MLPVFDRVTSRSTSWDDFEVFSSFASYSTIPSHHLKCPPFLVFTFHKQNEMLHYYTQKLKNRLDSIGHEQFPRGSFSTFFFPKRKRNVGKENEMEQPNSYVDKTRLQDQPIKLKKNIVFKLLRVS